MASPRASIIVVEVVGARPRGHASVAWGSGIVTLAFSASELSARAVITMSGMS